MRRTLIIAAMLLPLPFAAIPIVSVVLSPAQPNAPGILAVNAAPAPDAVDEGIEFEATGGDEISLTFRTGNRYSDCPRTSTTSIEG